jgi:hypothetical protein
MNENRESCLIDKKMSCQQYSTWLTWPTADVEKVFLPVQYKYQAKPSTSKKNSNMEKGKRKKYTHC